jgi:heme exporter protein C
MKKLIQNIAWWKWASLVLITFSLIEGLLGDVPEKPILNETIRNLYYHVPMWFGMIAVLTLSAVYSIKFLRNGNLKDDQFAVQGANVGVAFGVAGIITGMLWANYTWGEPWSGDPKQNGAAIGLLIYCAYLVLRGSITDDIKRGRIAAVYNLLAYPLFITVIFILPRLTDSLHPGSGGNPGFNAYDLDSRMRMVFYPAVLGWILLGCWIAQILKII